MNGPALIVWQLAPRVGREKERRAFQACLAFTLEQALVWARREGGGCWIERLGNCAHRRGGIVRWA